MPERPPHRPSAPFLARPVLSALLLATLPAAALAVDFPVLRPGLWESTVFAPVPAGPPSRNPGASPSTPAAPPGGRRAPAASPGASAGGATAPAPMTSRMCIDAQSQRELIAMGQGMVQTMCRRSELRADGNRYVAEAECDLGATRSRSRSVMTVVGDSAYRIEVQASFDPPMMGMKESRTTVDARHVGACPAGMRPGDMTLPDGRTINVRQMMQSSATSIVPERP